MGTVVDTMYHEPETMREGQVAPYQVRLDDGTLIFAPRDADDCIRAVFP